MVSYEERLINCFTKFEFKEIIGFAHLCGVDSEIIKKTMLNSAAKGSSDLEEIVCSTLEVYGGKSRKVRRELLKLAEKIALENRREKENKPDIVE